MPPRPERISAGRALVTRTCCEGAASPDEIVDALAPPQDT